MPCGETHSCVKQRKTYSIDKGKDLKSRNSSLSMFRESSPTACLSTQEAEYIALSEATKEALNLRMLLRDLGFGLSAPMTLFSDNKGAISMSQHPTNKPATRHVDMRIRMCRQHVELGNIKTEHMPGTDLPADMCSKQTVCPTHEKHTA